MKATSHCVGNTLGDSRIARRTLLLLIAASAAACVAAPLPPVNTRGGTSMRVNRGANVRSEANKNSRRITTVAAGTYVIVLGRSGNWHRIEHGGLRGWMHKSLLGPRPKKVVRKRPSATGGSTTSAATSASNASGTSGSSTAPVTPCGASANCSDGLTGGAVLAPTSGS